MSNDERSEPPAAGQYRIPAISRSIAVLEALVTSGRPLRLSEIARELKIPRASLFSILATLVEERMVEREGVTYRPGERLALFTAPAGPGLARASRPVLARLVAKLSESAQVAVLHDASARYVDALEGTQTLRVATWIGKRNALDRTAIGKALILETPAEELRELLHDLDYDEFAHLQEELAEAREKGYTTDEGRGEVGVYCVGTPIRDRSGRIAAALSVSAPEASLSADHLAEMIELVQQAAEEISAGWSGSLL